MQVTIEIQTAPKSGGGTTMTSTRSAIFEPSPSTVMYDAGGLPGRFVKQVPILLKNWPKERLAIEKTDCRVWDVRQRGILFQLPL